MSILLDHAEMILSRAVGVNAAFAVASIGPTSTRKWRRVCDRSPNEVCRPAPVRSPFATLAPCLNNGDKCERPYVGCIVIAGSGRIFRRRSRSVCTSTAREQLTSRLRRMIGSQYLVIERFTSIDTLVIAIGAAVDGPALHR